MKKTIHTTTKDKKHVKMKESDGLSVFSGRHTYPNGKKKKLTYKLSKSLFTKIEIERPTTRHAKRTCCMCFKKLSLVDSLCMILYFCQNPQCPNYALLQMPEKDMP